MSTISKIQASLLQGSQETTLALANANFDFSLVKIEAPPEYKGLGSALSAKKRSEAEFGSAHSTARRLGNLFQSILPETPYLIKAYGHRASEIAESLATTPEATEAYGPFKDYIGVDGTSIWAAATSSPAAIACHLLACILASLWTPAEATAIWLEIIADRKRQLEQKAAQSGAFIFNEGVTAMLPFEKDQLAAWDNSARAWLAAASESPPVRSRQKIVTSLLSRVNASVQGRKDVYTSVTEAWKLSLLTFEKLICGMSQSVPDGVVIIALLSWHIYPDLILMSPKLQEIRQNDELIQSSQVTIGLTRHDELPHDNGVHWSLSLAHLRYYGSVQVTSRSLRCTPSGNNRFTIDEFILVVIGACAGEWSTSERVTMDFAIDFLILAMTRFEHVLSESRPSNLRMVKDSWVPALLNLLASTKQDSQEGRGKARKLLTLGWRNHQFLNKIMNGQRSFGLSALDLKSIFIERSRSRCYARDMIQDFLSRCERERMCLVFHPKEHNPEYHYHLTVKFYSQYEFPCPWAKSKDNSEIQEKNPDGSYLIDQHYTKLIRSRSSRQPTLTWEPPSPVAEQLTKFVPRVDIDGENDRFKFYLITQIFGEEVYANVPIDTQVFNFPAPRLQHYLGTEKIDPESLLNFLEVWPFSRLCRVLFAAKDLYIDLPGVTVSPSILERRLDESLLSSVLQGGEGAVLRPAFKQGGAFRLLVLLQTGYDLGLENGFQRWQSLLAVSIEDTLFMDSRVIGNPRPGVQSGLRHVRGNVGTPGVALIEWHPPENTLDIKKQDFEKWQVVNHYPFDGKLEDSLHDTSLHLRLTGYSEDIDFGARNRISNGTVLDAVVAVFGKRNRDEWIGDINILDALNHLDPKDTTPPSPQTRRSPKFRVVRRHRGCLSNNVGKPPPEEMVKIECWDELLSPPPFSKGIVMCHGNWQARLAALALCKQLGYHTILFNDHGCWDCALATLSPKAGGLTDALVESLSLTGILRMQMENQTDDLTNASNTIEDDVGSTVSYASGPVSSLGSSSETAEKIPVIFIL
ncbi:hypothetical protein F5Y16DRAFT_398643 [Xylariaceae sp. FL0255]|nr:hypothetical protein F5Y16DRAFT_398643 [Xylariaceae sp. FL0255]